MKSVLRHAIFNVLVLMLPVGPSYSADSLTVLFRFTDTSGAAVRTFVPGEFNNWGPNSAGVIAAGAPSAMHYLAGAGYWQKAVRLEIGKSYAYKFHLHLDPSGSSSQWLSDPLNPLTDGSLYGNSLVTVTNPMIFEPEARKNPGGSTVKIVAGLFSLPGVQRVTLFVDGDSTDITSSFDAATGILSYIPGSPIAQTRSITIKGTDNLGAVTSYTFPALVRSNRKLDVTFLFHANQNLVPYGKVADRACFRGLLETLRKHPTQKFQIHFSGTTVHDLLWFNDTTLQILKAGIRDGQFEVFGSAYAQNVMYSTRKDSNDVEFNDHQIKFQKEQIQKVLGVTPKAFWNPERVWTQNFVQLLADNGYLYVPVEDHILQSSGATAPLYQVRTTHYQGRRLTVFEDDKQFLPLVDNAVNTGDIAPVMNFLHTKYQEDTADTYVIGYYQDAEATGLWDLEQGINPQSNFDNLDKLLTALAQDTLIKVTTYEEFLKGNAPTSDLSPILDGAAAWMGYNAWFTENQDPAFQTMRKTYDSLRVYLDSVAQVIRTFPGDTTGAVALLRHAWFTLCAHQFEFGCHGLQGDIRHTQLQLARTCAVAATAALYAVSPATKVFAADINRDGVNEIVMVTPQNLFVFSPYGGRLLYWFDLAKGEELVGNENFSADYGEPYINDNTALPLIRGGIETYPWLHATTVLPEILQWTYTVRRRALNDVLALSPSGSVPLDNTPYIFSISGNSLTFSTTLSGIQMKKVVTPEPTGIHVTYHFVSTLAQLQSVVLEVQNSFSPSSLEIMDNGRRSLAYWNGSGNPVTQGVSSSTTGVVNAVTQSQVSFNWESPFSALSGAEDVFGLELNPQFSVQLNPGASADFTFSLRHSQSTSSGVAATVSFPRRFELFQNYPNPFNPSTTIRYSLPTRSYVTLTVFNTLGQKVRSLAEGERGAGYHEVTLDGTNLSSGVYLYRLSTGTYVETRKLVLLR